LSNVRRVIFKSNDQVYFVCFSIFRSKFKYLDPLRVNDGLFLVHTAFSLFST
jgi:hypothetical protein